MDIQIKSSRAVLATDSAVKKLIELKSEETAEESFLRMGVKPGGCSGYSYEMFFDTDKFDGDVIKKLKPSATMHAIILPNQTIGDTFRLEEPARNMILQEKVKLTAKIEIRYQGNRQSHYFISTFVFNPQNKKLILVEADAN